MISLIILIKVFVDITNTDDIRKLVSEKVQTNQSAKIVVAQYEARKAAISTSTIAQLATSEETYNNKKINKNSTTKTKTEKGNVHFNGHNVILVTLGRIASKHINKTTAKTYTGKFPNFTAN